MARITFSPHVMRSVEQERKMVDNGDMELLADLLKRNGVEAVTFAISALLSKWADKMPNEHMADHTKSAGTKFFELAEYLAAREGGIN